MSIADDIADKFMADKGQPESAPEQSAERPGAMLRKAIKAGDDSAIEAAIHACMESQY